jgi:hypothetical protein
VDLTGSARGEAQWRATANEVTGLLFPCKVLFEISGSHGQYDDRQPSAKWCHAVWQKKNDVSEVLTASIIREVAFYQTNRRLSSPKYFYQPSNNKLMKEGPTTMDLVTPPY